ncbi:hypothetical protein [Halolamina rubra]|uniref:hypothetical protein n=1 Tax=Halolamina rubra TaxID=1380430 RepID=UPI000679CF99|nr:hypothetical protein [Halolamina rubra]
MVPTTLEVERLDGTDKVQFRYTFDLPNDTTRFEILSTSQDDGYSITATTGFSEGQQLTWDGKTASPSLTLEYTLPNDSNAGLRRVRTPFVGGQIERGDPPEEGHVDMVYKEPVNFDLDTTVEVTGEGRYVAGTVVLGSYTTYTETSYGQEITLFVPDGVDMAVSPEDAVTALVATERTIQGDPHRDTYVFVQEGQIAAGGAGSTTARVFAGSDLEIYIHEQAHLDEVAYYDRKMGWFTEASATYYGSDFYVVDGELRLKPAKLLERTDPETKWPRGDHHNDSVLAEPSTWDSKTDYQKGSRLLFALDAKLRAATDGDATIHDLMRRVNEEGGYRALNYTEFRGIVVDLGGEGTGSWLDPYVLTSQNPPQPNASAFGPTPTFANGTTNTSGDSRETFEFGIDIPSEDPQAPSPRRWRSTLMGRL